MPCLSGCAPFSGRGTSGLLSAYCSPIDVPTIAAVPTIVAAVEMLTVNPATESALAVPNPVKEALAPVALRMARPIVSATGDAPCRQNRQFRADDAAGPAQ